MNKLILLLIAIFLYACSNDPYGPDLGNPSNGEVILNGEVKSEEGEPIPEVRIQAFAHFEKDCEEGDIDPIRFRGQEDNGSQIPETNENGVYETFSLAEEGKEGQCIEINATPMQGNYKNKEFTRNIEFEYIKYDESGNSRPEIITIDFNLEDSI